MLVLMLSILLGMRNARADELLEGEADYRTMTASVHGSVTTQHRQSTQLHSAAKQNCMNRLGKAPHQGLNIVTSKRNFKHHKRISKSV
jgi:hypothetical protein